MHKDEYSLDKQESQNINDKSRQDNPPPNNGGTGLPIDNGDDNNYSPPSFTSGTVPPPLSEEEQEALNNERNSPEFQRKLQDILPKEQAKITDEDKKEIAISTLIEEWQETHKSPDSAEENTTGIPDDLRFNIEALSGIGLDDVTVHYNSPLPAEYNAFAFTKGTEVHIGANQEEYLAHELWHVIQQKRATVKPTMQLKSEGINDDSALEQQADKMGQKAEGMTTSSDTSKQDKSVGAPVMQRAEDGKDDKEEDKENNTVGNVKSLSEDLISEFLKNRLYQYAQQKALEATGSAIVEKTANKGVEVASQYITEVLQSKLANYKDYILWGANLKKTYESLRAFSEIPSEVVTTFLWGVGRLFYAFSKRYKLEYTEVEIYDMLKPGEAVMGNLRKFISFVEGIGPKVEKAVAGYTNETTGKVAGGAVDGAVKGGIGGAIVGMGIGAWQGAMTSLSTGTTDNSSENNGIWGRIVVGVLGGAVKGGAQYAYRGALAGGAVGASKGLSDATVGQDAGINILRGFLKGAISASKEASRLAKSTQDHLVDLALYPLMGGVSIEEATKSIAMNMGGFVAKDDTPSQSLHQDPFIGLDDTDTNAPLEKTERSTTDDQDHEGASSIEAKEKDAKKENEQKNEDGKEFTLVDNGFITLKVKSPKLEKWKEKGKAGMELETTVTLNLFKDPKTSKIDIKLPFSGGFDVSMKPFFNLDIGSSGWGILSGGNIVGDEIEITDSGLEKVKLSFNNFNIMDGLVQGGMSAEYNQSAKNLNFTGNDISIKVGSDDIGINSLELIMGTDGSFERFHIDVEDKANHEFIPGLLKVINPKGKIDIDKAEKLNLKLGAGIDIKDGLITGDLSFEYSKEKKEFTITGNGKAKVWDSDEAILDGGIELTMGTDGTLKKLHADIKTEKPINVIEDTLDVELDGAIDINGGNSINFNIGAGLDVKNLPGGIKAKGAGGVEYQGSKFSGYVTDLKLKIPFLNESGSITFDLAGAKFDKEEGITIKEASMDIHYLKENPKEKEATDTEDQQSKDKGNSDTENPILQLLPDSTKGLLTDLGIGLDEFKYHFGIKDFKYLNNPKTEGQDDTKDEKLLSYTKDEENNGLKRFKAKFLGLNVSYIDEGDQNEGRIEGKTPEYKFDKTFLSLKFPLAHTGLYAGLELSARLAFQASLGGGFHKNSDKSTADTSIFDLSGSLKASASAGIGVKIILGAGIPHIAGLEGYIKGIIDGTVAGKVDLETGKEGGVSVRYNHKDKKMELDGEPSLSLSLGAELSAKIEAGLDATFLFYKKELLKFTSEDWKLGQIQIAGTISPDSSGGYKFELDDTKNSDPKKLFPNDISSPEMGKIGQKDTQQNMFRAAKFIAYANASANEKDDRKGKYKEHLDDKDKPLFEEAYSAITNAQGKGITGSLIWHPDIWAKVVNMTGTGLLENSSDAGIKDKKVLFVKFLRTAEAKLQDFGKKKNTRKSSTEETSESTPTLIPLLKDILEKDDKKDSTLVILLSEVLKTDNPEVFLKSLGYKEEELLKLLKKPGVLGRLTRWVGEETANVQSESKVAIYKGLEAYHVLGEEDVTDRLLILKSIKPLLGVYAQRTNEDKNTNWTQVDELEIQIEKEIEKLGEKKAKN